MNRRLVFFYYTSPYDSINQYNDSGENIIDNLVQLYDEAAMNYVRLMAPRNVPMGNVVDHYPESVIYLTPPWVRRGVTATDGGVEDLRQALQEMNVPDQRVNEMIEIAAKSMINRDNRQPYRRTYMFDMEMFCGQTQTIARKYLEQVVLLDEDPANRQRIPIAFHRLDHFHPSVALEQLITVEFDTIFDPIIDDLEAGYMLLSNAYEASVDELRALIENNGNMNELDRVEYQVYIFEFWCRALSYNHFLIHLCKRLLESFYFRKQYNSTLSVPVPKIDLLHDNDFTSMETGRVVGVVYRRLGRRPRMTPSLSVALARMVVAVFYEFDNYQDTIEELLLRTGHQVTNDTIQGIKVQLLRYIVDMYQTIINRINLNNQDWVVDYRVVGYL
jgi:hypothetical protein